MGIIRDKFSNLPRRSNSTATRIMKLLVTSLASLAAIVTAQEEPLRKFSHITAMVYTQLDGKTQHSSKQINKMIQNYGCHCFPGLAKIAGGAGPAQDNYDALCRDLARCHKCVEMDHQTFLDTEWDSNIGKYRWDLNADNTVSCAANTEQHKFDLCTCDANYAMALGAVWDDAAYDYTIWGGKKNALFNFDYEGVCVRSQMQDADSCCGQYPTRYPFDSSSRMCCDNVKTYDDSTRECCDNGDGTIASIGSC